MALKDTTSLRITFEKEDIDFMNDYKKAFGSSIQWFVEKSVKAHIKELKIKQQLKEQPYAIREQKTDIS